ncbi:MAG: hypothetical protein HQL02_03155 [Nitrospirae bacterium]|nr:hypothetical protein [Nitrospirota bacterium]
MIDYTIFYKSNLQLNEEWSEENRWDLFISAFNSNKRVQTVYDKVKATIKYWLLLQDYNYKDGEHPISNIYIANTKNEGECINDYFKGYLHNKGYKDIRKLKICIDITGFIRPYLMYLIRYLKYNDVNKVDIIYSEPSYYKNKEKTEFSGTVVSKVRQVDGFQGSHNTTYTSNEILIIGCGYETELIKKVAEHKNNTKKILVFGFPSLQATMYQDNILRTYEAKEPVSFSNLTTPPCYFAPANDPFVVASVLSEIVKEANQKKKITNLYLSPLATKPQVLGFVLYYLTECIDKEVSIIFPYTNVYAKETATEISRIWKYQIEFYALK